MWLGLCIQTTQCLEMPQHKLMLCVVYVLMPPHTVCHPVAVWCIKSWVILWGASLNIYNNHVQRNMVITIITWDGGVDIEVGDVVTEPSDTNLHMVLSLNY